MIVEITFLLSNYLSITNDVDAFYKASNPQARNDSTFTFGQEIMVSVWSTIIYKQDLSFWSLPTAFKRMVKLV